MTKLKKAKLVSLLGISVISLLSGCNTTGSSSSSSASYHESNKAFNVLGIYSYAPNSYKDVPNASFDMKSCNTRKNISGTNHSFLWGLVEVADY